MISIVHDSWISSLDLESLTRLLDNKVFLTGANVTFIDFCVFESLDSYEGELPENLRHYKDRMKALGEPVAKPSAGNSKML